MASYIVNKNHDDHNNHEVHNKDICSYLPNEVIQEELGDLNNCYEAVTLARERHTNWKIDGCKHCCPECHDHR